MPYCTARGVGPTTARRPLDDRQDVGLTASGSVGQRPMIALKSESIGASPRGKSSKSAAPLAARGSSSDMDRRNPLPVPRFDGNRFESLSGSLSYFVVAILVQRGLASDFVDPLSD